jgi:hypothetical protein
MSDVGWNTCYSSALVPEHSRISSSSTPLSLFLPFTISHRSLIITMDSVQALAQPALEFVQLISLAPFNLGVQITAVALPCLLLSETAHSTLGRWIFKPLASLGFIVAALSYIPNNTSTFVASSTAVVTTHSAWAEIPKAIASTGAAELAKAYFAELKHVLFNVAPTIASSSSGAAAAAAAAHPVVHSTYTQAMMVAFVLGFLGDVLLIPARGFLPGLTSFLLGHAAFMVAFTFHGQDTVTRQKGLGFIVTMAAIVGPWLLPKIKNKVMRGAVRIAIVLFQKSFSPHNCFCGLCMHACVLWIGCGGHTVTGDLSCHLGRCIHVGDQWHGLDRLWQLDLGP